MAQAQLPFVTVPLATYTDTTQMELKNIAREGEGVRITFSREASWPASGPLFTIAGEVSEAQGQPDYKPWFSDQHVAEPDLRHPATKISQSYWQGEPDGSGGKRKVKGDIRFTLTVAPGLSMQTTITAEII